MDCEALVAPKVICLGYSRQAFLEPPGVLPVYRNIGSDIHHVHAAEPFELCSAYATAHGGLDQLVDQAVASTTHKGSWHSR